MLRSAAGFGVSEGDEEPELPGLGGLELKELLRAGRLLHIPTGSVLCEEGQLNSRCYVVTRGSVEVAKTVNGIYRPLSQNGPGSILALMATLDSGPCRVSIHAIEEARVIELPREGLLSIFSVDDYISDGLAQKLTIMATRRLRRATDDLAQAIHRSISGSGRLGHIAIPDLAMIHAGNHAWKPEV